MVGLCVGFIDLGLLLPMHTVEFDPGRTASESADPAILVKELARLEGQITDQAKSATQEEAISNGIRANHQLLQAFRRIQQHEGNSLPPSASGTQQFNSARALTLLVFNGGHIAGITLPLPQQHQQRIQIIIGNLLFSQARAEVE